MATARVERLVNLVLCLLSTRQYLTAERIRATVPGYGGAASDEAFYRMFERDKAELRDLGVPLETGRNSIVEQVDGYRIARRDYELGEIDLSPEETAAVGVAVRLWDAPEFTAAARSGLRKLRAAGVDVDEDAPAVVEPRVRGEPAVSPLVAAVRQARPVTFDYRRPGDQRAAARHLEPWGVVSWRGRWYVVGHDRDRRAARCFRLSRITGDVRLTGRAGQVGQPADVDLLRIVAGSDRESAGGVQAAVWVAAGRAHGLRRHGAVVQQRTIDGEAGDVLHLDVDSPEAAAPWLAGYGPDALVLAPEPLCKAVDELHRAAVRSAEEHA
ncbi:helix-turn-helix transcriptional regulator [Salinifilum ghardaiensis]